jgi:hypothetical protein
LRVLKNSMPENTFRNFKGNILFFLFIFYILGASEYLFGEGFSRTSDFNSRWELFRCVLYFLSYFVGEIIPCGFFLFYLYKLKDNDTRSTLIMDIAEEILGRYSGESIFNAEYPTVN